MANDSANDADLASNLTNSFNNVLSSKHQENMQRAMEIQENVNKFKRLKQQKMQQ